MSAIFQPPKETDVAYLAGLMDGEGCMAIRQHKGSYKTLTMEIVGTDRTPLDWAQSRFGGTVRKLQEKRENRRQPWHWQVTRGEHLSAIAFIIRPYLKVKWGEATLLIIIGHLRRMRKNPFGPTEHRKAEDHLARLSTLLKQPGKGGVAAYEEALDLAVYLKGALIEQEAKETRMLALVMPNACPPHPLTETPCIDSPGHEASHSDGQGRYWWDGGFGTSKDVQNVDTS